MKSLERLNLSKRWATILTRYRSALPLLPISQEPFPTGLHPYFPIIHWDPWLPVGKQHKHGFSRLNSNVTQLCHLCNLAGAPVPSVSYRYVSCSVYHPLEVTALSSQIMWMHSWDVSGSDVSVCCIFLCKWRVTCSWIRRRRRILVWRQMTQIAWACHVALLDASVWSSLNLSSEFFLFVKWG